MAMKKAELAHHRDRYSASIADARLRLQQERYAEAVEIAVSSWEHIDGMMQFERKFLGTEFASVEGIEIVLTYAPLLFDFESLNKLDALLRSVRRIDKHATDDLARKLSESRSLMWQVHHLWDHLEGVSESSDETIHAALGGDTEPLLRMIDAMEQMGAVRRAQKGRSNAIALSTRMDEVTSAKCPSCGAVVTARKSRLLEDASCPRCQSTVSFVLLAEMCN